MRLAVALAVTTATVTGSLAATKNRHSPNPAWDVYDSRGVNIGSDPDARIRADLARSRVSE
jgi:hypothetical protein